MEDKEVIKTDKKNTNSSNSYKQPHAFILTVLIVLVIIVLIIVYAGFTGKINNNSGINSEIKTEEVHIAAPTNIYIDTKQDAIDISLSDSDKLEIEYKSVNNLKYTINNSGSEIRIQGKEEGVGISRWFRVKNHKTTIKLPKNMVKNLDIVNKNAVISISDIQLENLNISDKNAIIKLSNVICNKGNIEIETTNALVDIKDLSSANKLTVRSTNGLLKFKEIEANLIDAQTTNGLVDIELLGKSEEYNKDIDTTNGFLNVDGNKYKSGVNSYNASNSKSVKIRSTNGSVTLSFR